MDGKVKSTKSGQNNVFAASILKQMISSNLKVTHNSFYTVKVGIFVGKQIPTFCGNVPMNKN